MLNEIIMGRLRAVRKNQELRQIDLAKKAGISKNMIIEYECSRISPTLDKVEDLMQALGITPEELFKDLDKKE